MKYTKKFMLAWLLSVTATTAQADDSRFSLFNCGLQLGGTSKAYRADYSSSKTRQHASREKTRSIEAETPTVSNFTGAKTKDIGRRRLPPTFTVASIGCSWR